MTALSVAGIRRVPAFVWLAAGGAAALAFVATVKGPGLSPDSVTYLSTGINLAESGELTMLDGSTLTIFPPGMSAVAALGTLSGVGSQTAVRALECLCAAAIVVLTFALMRRLAIRHSVQVVATVFVALSPITLSVSTMAWSDLPFMVVSLVVLLLLGEVWHAGRVSVAQVAALAVLCWVAFFLRYAGVALIVATAVVLVVGSRVSARRRALDAMAFGALALAAPLAWMVRNHSVDGTWLGPRGESRDNLGFVVKRTVGAVGYWIAPGADLPEKALIVIGFVALLATAALMVLVVTRDRRSGGDQLRLRAFGGPAVVFGLVYVAHLSAAQLTTVLDPIDSRLMAAVYVPLLMVWALGLSCLLDLLPSMRHTARVRAGLAAPLLVVLAGQMWATVDDARFAYSNGLYFNAQVWTQSELADLAKAASEDGATTVYTNNTGMLWAASGLQHIQDAPRRQAYRGGVSVGELERFAEAVNCAKGRVVLAMFVFGEPVYTVEEMSELLQLTPLATAVDGVLYEVTAKDGAFGQEPVECSAAAR